jgi:hypothetical protein
MEPVMGAAFVEMAVLYEGVIDLEALERALRAGSWPDIESAMKFGQMDDILARAGGFTSAFSQVVARAGQAGQEIMLAAGISAQFNAVSPNAVFFASQKSSELIRGITAEARDTIREIIATGQRLGLPTNVQAGAIRDYITLPRGWASAPMNMARELETGDRAVFRRLLADPSLPPRERRLQERALRLEIAERYATGANTDPAWIRSTTAEYKGNLLNRRAQTIARTETVRAANWAVKEGWTQAVASGALPSDVKKVWLVTSDDRLQHEMVPGMNAGGRRLDELFETPEGPVQEPPSRPNCRCGIGLIFPGLSGTL